MATTTVLADLVRGAGGDQVVVESLVPRNADVHTFEPRPEDVRKVAQADLIVMNGLGLDESLRPVIEQAGPNVPVIELAENLPGVEYLEAGDHVAGPSPVPGGSAQPASGHAGEEINPHLWLNVAYAQRFVERIVQGLKDVAPDRAATLEASGAAYARMLAELDGWVRDRLATVPAGNRRVISYHEAFPYFARAYGLEIVDTVVEAPGQEPSAKEIAALIDLIRSARVKAIFSEVQFSPKLVTQLAAETGVTVVADLYNDALGDPPVDTYEGMMRWNAERIAAALRD